MGLLQANNNTYNYIGIPCGTHTETRGDYSFSFVFARFLQFFDMFQANNTAN